MGRLSSSSRNKIPPTSNGVILVPNMLASTSAVTTMEKKIGAKVSSIVSPLAVPSMFVTGLNYRKY